MKNYLTALLLFVFMFGGSALAGPLDRMSEPRTNPAVDDMMRIPGVVGLTRQEALATLQQAGLNPVLKLVRTQNSKHQGMEGKVIVQSPNPGGVAMIGSSVSIELYLPPGYEEPAADTWQNDPYQDQSGGYDGQWQGDTYSEDQSGGSTEGSGDNSGTQWQWQGPDNSSGDTPGKFKLAPVKPREVQKYSPDQTPAGQPLVSPGLKPMPMQRAQ